MNFDDSSSAFLSSYLTNVRLNGYNSTYVIGTFDQKKTVATQQQRASVLALAAAREHASEKKKVAIVGGGFAGISCAATLLKLGFEVCLFEQKDRLIPIQARCVDRFLHPTLYDWPHYDNDGDFIMSGIRWHPGYAKEVAQEAINSFEAIAGRYKNSFEPKFGIRIDHIKQENDSSVSLFSEKRHRFRGFTAVFVAVGFGFERPVSVGNRIRKYWDNSALDHIHGRKYEPAKVLVSGAGDGGLISVLNCVMKNYDHRTLHLDFEHLLSSDILDEIKTTEATIRRDFRVRKEVNIIDRYDSIFESYVSTIKAGLSELVSSETSVTFNSHLQGVFTPGSSAINRIIVYFLMRSDLIYFVGDKLDGSMVDEDDSGEALKHTVNWLGSAKHYDHIIVRHGVVKDHFLKTFPEIDRSSLPEKIDGAGVLPLEDAIPDRVLSFLKDL